MWRTIRSLIGGAVGRVAQRESTAFTRQGSQVQSLSRPPFFHLISMDYKFILL